MPKFNFSGTCRDTLGNALPDVKVDIIIPGYKNASTKSGYDGNFNLTIDTGNIIPGKLGGDNPNSNSTFLSPYNAGLKNQVLTLIWADIIFTFTRPGKETRSIRNPKLGKGKDNTSFTLNADFKTYIDPKYGGILDLKGLYKSGKWKISSIAQGDKQTIIDENIKNVYEFIKNNPRNTKLTIKSSESRVPNNDNEEGSKRDFSKKGSLALARADALKAYILNSLSELSQNDPNFEIPNIIIDNPIQGQVPWPDTDKNKKIIEEQKPVDDEGNPITNPANLQRYTDDQWVKLYAELIITKTGCLGAGFIIFDVFVNGHGCNGAVYEVRANDVLLNRDDGQPFASLNNFPKEWDHPASASLKPYVKKYDNILSGYHIEDAQFSTRNAFNNDTDVSSFEKRFKIFKLNSIFPTPTNPIPKDQIPTVPNDGGPRYNRFIITPDVFKKIKEQSEKETIKFEIRCSGMVDSNNKPIPVARFGLNCHGDLGDFNLYKLDPDSSGKLVVTYTTGTLRGTTPTTRGVPLYLFEFDPCTNRIIDRNPNVFKFITLDDNSSDNDLK